MSFAELTPPEAARWARAPGWTCRAPRPVAATADQLLSLVAVLRELDFGETPPAAAYRAQEGTQSPEGTRDAAL
ncbi:hypothetical protein GXW82_11570 [Streptacidiphilus sp. 4-A2]|nr:hypothetical protein [Streptacidiphilus sp. 4-A2]